MCECFVFWIGEYFVVVGVVCEGFGVGVVMFCVCVDGMIC